MYNDRSLQHPVITQIERNGYPDEYPDEQADECAWCSAHFRVRDNMYMFCGEFVCQACFKQWVSELPLTDIADALDIQHDVYG